MTRMTFIIIVIFFLFNIALPLSRGEGPDQFVGEYSFIENVRITHVTSNSVDWTAEIEKVIIDPDNKKSRMNILRFQFPVNNVNIQSEHGTFDLLSDDLTLDDKVTATKKDMQIRTGPVFWDSTSKTINSYSAVQIIGNFFKINGEGLEIKSNGNMLIKKNVNAVVY